LVSLILDTNVTVALLNDGDPNHERCRALVESIREPLVIPAATLGEVDYWVQRFMGVRVWRAFAQDVESGAYLLEPTTEQDLSRASELQEQYEDLRLGYVDSAVIALCERMREPKVATIDRRHFSVVVPRHVPALELLPH
ncbi:MAG: PIN domain-containing protein, partial [Dehalococcoidia bacterium]